MLIPLDAIDPPANPVRLRVSAEADAALAASVRELGVVTPVLVVRNGPRFQLVAGARRVRAARAAGLAEIPAEIAARFDEGYVHAAGTAENLVRQGMDPIDQWRAIAEMQRLGYTLPAAAAALGLDERHARRLDRLGHLHPDVLALIGEAGMPPTRDLATIANAPPATQAAALKAKGAMTRHKDDGLVVAWWKIAEACTATRIPRSRAIFDIEAAGVAFEEDLFAEPDSDAAWTTTDVAGFLSAQGAALETRVDRLRAARKGGGAEIVGFDAGTGRPKLPKGWMSTAGNPDKPRKQETVFFAISEAGWQFGAVVAATAENAAEAKARQRQADAKAKARAAQAAPPPAPDPDDDGEHHPDNGADEDDAGQADAADDAPARPEPRSPLTRQGQRLLAEAKTTALRARLRDATHPLPLEALVVHLVLALHATNVTIAGSERSAGTYHRYTGEDLVRRLIAPDGQLSYDAAELPSIAAEALARTLSFSHPESPAHSPGSGATAEWIGHATGAADHLPRLDTPPILATLNAEALRDAADRAGIKAKTATALRTALAGKLPHWQPPWSHFGAPGPRPAASQPTSSDEGEGDA